MDFKKTCSFVSSSTAAASTTNDLNGHQPNVDQLLNEIDFPKVEYISPDSASRCTWTLNENIRSTLKNPHAHRPFQKKAKVFDSILEHIGDTPLVRLDRIREHYGLKCQLLGKCEFFNPGGSIKDRIGWRMVQDAEKDGLLKPGYTIIEPTSGNTGIGIALASAVRGYQCIIVMPEKMSNEKVNVLHALGAEIIRTPTSARFDAPNSNISVAQKLRSKIKNSIILDQYRNPSNPLAHYDNTGVEILDQTDGKVDMVVIGAGTGGTVTGVGRRIKETVPGCKIIGVDPVGSILSEPDELNNLETTFYEVEGIGYDFIPTVLDRSVVDEWIKVEDRDSFRLARLLIQMEGLLCGGSSGSALAAALKVAHRLDETQTCVIILPDGVRNYMTKFLDDDWMADRNFELPKSLKQNEPRPWFFEKPILDMIEGTTVKTIHEQAKCIEAIQLMKENGFDQIPVVEKSGTKVLLGMITVMEIMAKLASGSVMLDSPVSKVLLKQFPLMHVGDPIGRLIKLLRRNSYVVVVEQGSNGLQLISAIITHIDILNFLTKLDHVQQL